MAKRRAPGGGRKPKGPLKGKSATITTRITPETRVALEEAAAASGRSLSQEIEIRLRHSVGPDEKRAKHIKAAEELIRLAAEETERLTGLGWLTDRFTAEALRHAIDHLLGRFAPPPDGERRVPARIERLASAMPNDTGDAYRRPISLGLMEASRLIALIEGAERPSAPPNEWSDPLNPDPQFRLWLLHQDLGLKNTEGRK
jgi:uncharacterized protein (DUF1778 family)